MTIRQNQLFDRLEDLEKSLLQRPYRRDGRKLTYRDRATWVEALILESLVVFDLFPSVSSDRITDWLARTPQFDVFTLVSVFKDADARLTSFYGGKAGEDVNIPQAHQLTTWLTDDLNYLRNNRANEILSLLRPPIALFLEQPTHEGYRKLHCALAFLSRTSLRDVEDAISIQKFIERNDSLTILPEYRKLLPKLNSIMREWLEGFAVVDVPHHGPGMVADVKGRSKVLKYGEMCIDDMLLYVFEHYYQGPNKLALVPPFARFGELDRTSVLTLVPKSATTKRTICKEPATLQFYQQMVKESLYDFISSNLKYRIDLVNQSRNRELARMGSISGTLSTIDLSAASDSVQWDLVREVFRGTQLLPWLYATRSRRIEVHIPGEKRPYLIEGPKLFAPMGSALCFPVECLVFASICEYVSRYAQKHSSYSVYGDDIIIETSLVADVIDILTGLGFSVNRDKSFYLNKPMSFRESCGGEYIDGKDVTPSRIPRRFCVEASVVSKDLLNKSNEYLREINVTDVEYATMFAMANDLFDACLVSPRRWILRFIKRLPPGFGPVWGLEPGLLKGYWGNNNNVIVTPDTNLQRLNVVGGALRAKPSLRDQLLRLRFEKKLSGTYLVPIYCFDLDEGWIRLYQEFIYEDEFEAKVPDGYFEELRLYEWFISSAKRQTVEYLPDTSSPFDGEFHSIDTMIQEAIQQAANADLVGKNKLHIEPCSVWGATAYVH